MGEFQVGLIIRFRSIAFPPGLCRAFGPESLSRPPGRGGISFYKQVTTSSLLFSTREEIRKIRHLPQKPGRAREKRRHLRLTIVFIPTSKVEARQNQR